MAGHPLETPLEVTQRGSPMRFARKRKSRASLLVCPLPPLPAPEQFSQTIRSGPKPAGWNAIPVEELAGPIVREADLEAAAPGDGLVFDDGDAVAMPSGSSSARISRTAGTNHRDRCYGQRDHVCTVVFHDLQPTGQRRVLQQLISSDRHQTVASLPRSRRDWAG